MSVRGEEERALCVSLVERGGEGRTQLDAAGVEGSESDFIVANGRLSAVAHNLISFSENPGATRWYKGKSHVVLIHKGALAQLAGKTREKTRGDKRRQEKTVGMAYSSGGKPNVDSQSDAKYCFGMTTWSKGVSARLFCYVWLGVWLSACKRLYVCLSSTCNLLLASVSSFTHTHTHTHVPVKAPTFHHQLI